MRMIKKLYCFLFKHDFVVTGKFDNERSQWGRYDCVRCGKYIDWQYDR
jgi:hypothetical protein